MANKKKTAPRSFENSTDLIGDKLNFEGREAYNPLRTNLMFSTKRNDRNARVIWCSDISYTISFSCV